MGPAEFYQRSGAMGDRLRASVGLSVLVTFVQIYVTGMIMSSFDSSTALERQLTPLQAENSQLMDTFPARKIWNEFAVALLVAVPVEVA